MTYKSGLCLSPWPAQGTAEGCNEGQLAGRWKGRGVEEWGGRQGRWAQGPGGTVAEWEACQSIGRRLQGRGLCGEVDQPRG